LNYDELTTPGQGNKRIPVPEHAEEPEKGALESVLDPMINQDCLTDMKKTVEHCSIMFVEHEKS
jgi:hypothetical protein